MYPDHECTTDAIPQDVFTKATNADSYFRAAIYRLRYFKDLSMGLEGGFAYNLGKPIIVGPDDDQRKTKICPTLIQFLRGIAKMFSVNDKLEFKIKPMCFLCHDIRLTSVAELCRIGCGRWRSAPFTPKQVYTCLKKLKKIGFIDYWSPFDPVTQRRKTLIRFRADNVITAIENARRVKKTGIDDRFPADETQPAAPVAKKATAVPANKIDDFMSTASYPDVGTCILSTASDAPPSSPLSSSSADPNENKSSAKQPDEFFVFPEFAKGSELEQMCLKVQDIFSIPGLTRKQVQVIQSAMSQGALARKMTLDILEEYDQYRIWLTEGDLSSCDLNYFLSNWYRVIKMLRNRKLVVSGAEQTAIALKSITPEKIDADLAWAKQMIDMQIATIETNYNRPVDVYELVRFGTTVPTTLYALYELGHSDLATDYLQLNREEIMKQIQDSPHTAFRMMQRSEAFKNAINPERKYWACVREWCKTQYTRLSRQLEQCSIWGVEQFAA